YAAEAAIVNYYQPRDTLTAHVDRSEYNMEAPLVATSLGQGGILLVGGHDREEAPLPLVVHSGDIVVMCGPGRAAYHGVPLVFTEQLPPFPASEVIREDESKEEWDTLLQFMSTCRMNISVRQL
ncbi:hypothetical protein GQ42DRAFT_107254, partial [Ramicandelaber brevisporus]